MIVRCSWYGTRQSGAALIIALTLIAALALLTTAAVRDTVVETAMTWQFTAGSAARLAAFSTLESIRSEPLLPADRRIRRQHHSGSGLPLDITVNIRYLGAAPPASADQNFTDTLLHHHELTVDVTGPRNLHHRRRLYLQTAAQPQLNSD